MLKGTIDEFPLIDVLGILQARNKTGRLEIERQAGRGLIYVRLGEPYYAESSLTRSLIGQKLVDIGAITDMQLRKALDRQAESGERLGQILLTHGVISGEHVAQAVISQIKDALADLLAWEAGEFRWEAGAEVEVEVPLFGATIGSTDQGSNPLAPHVIPVTAPDPDTGPALSVQPEATMEQSDFPQGGTTTTGNEVTAMPNETSPDAGEEANLEIVSSSSEIEDEFKAEEALPDEPQEEQEPEPVQEFEAQTEQEPEPVQEFEAQTEQEPEPVQFEARTEQEPEPVQFEARTEQEPEPVQFEAQTEQEPEPVQEFEPPQPEPVQEVEPPQPEPVHEFQSQDEQAYEPVLPPLTIDTGAQEQPEALPSFYAPRVIKSQPAPELDEEFEAVFEATEHVSFDAEPPVEPAAAPVFEAPPLDPPPVTDPVFGAEAFKPVAPDNDFDLPTFEPEGENADPVFDPANFEPVTETLERTPEPAPEPMAETLGAPDRVFETLGPEPDFDPAPVDFAPPVPEFQTQEASYDPAAEEPAIETPEPMADMVQPEPVEAAPEMPAAESMPLAPSPPPPPPDTPPAAEAIEPAPSQEPAGVPAEEPSPATNGADPESLQDIKLDRSSLVRELSDLLR